MNKVVVLGAGKIGSAIIKMLLNTGKYEVTVMENSASAIKRIFDTVSVHKENLSLPTKNLEDTFKSNQAVISAMPYFENKSILDFIAMSGTSYFDLTEDVATTKIIQKYAANCNDGQIYMPQCGLAPGFIGIAASALAKEFEPILKVKMRVGALPQFPNNRLKYNITWSVDGLVNEYLEPCESIVMGKKMLTSPLENKEMLSINGAEYEAFNTSGGLGTLCDTLGPRIVEEMDYKTIRYPGHCELMKFLLHDLGFGFNRRKEAVELLERSLPYTQQDVVLTYVSVVGFKNGKKEEKYDVRVLKNKQINNENWTAIQYTTAAGICACVDLFFSGSLPKKGFVRQEDVDFDQFLGNRFGRNYERTT